MMLTAYVQKKKAVFYTLEMPAITLARRMDSVVADIVLSFTQTPQEKRNQRLRVHGAKQRNESAGQVVPILTNFAKGAFFRFVA